MLHWLTFIPKYPIQLQQPQTITLVFVYKCCIIKFYGILNGVTLCSNTFPVLQNVFKAAGKGFSIKTRAKLNIHTFPLCRVQSPVSSGLAHLTSLAVSAWCTMWVNSTVMRLVVCIWENAAGISGKLDLVYNCTDIIFKACYGYVGRKDRSSLSLLPYRFF